MNKRFAGLLFFAALLLLPFIPVVTSLVSLRSAVILDEKVNWQEGAKQTFAIPAAAFDNYEFRLESTESKWEPVVKAKWALLDGKGEVLKASPPEGQEWIIVRPLATFAKAPGQDPRTLEIEFLSSNPEPHEIRLKVSQDRGVLLEKSERLFVVLLALSLGLLLVVRKPFLMVPSR